MMFSKKKKTLHCVEKKMVYVLNKSNLLNWKSIGSVRRDVLEKVPNNVKKIMFGILRVTECY